MKIIVPSIILLTTVMAGFLIAKPRTNKDFKAQTYHSPQGGTLPYQIYIPEDPGSNELYPLVIFLHGSGQRGNDNANQLLLGVRDIRLFSIQQSKPAIIIAPQIPHHDQWVNISANSHPTDNSALPTVSMKLTIDLMNHIIKTLPVDKNRIYVTGLSIGGFGTWDLIQRFPDTFAAAIPVCGGGNKNKAEQIKHIPIWAFHGDKDMIVDPNRSREMISAIKKAGGNPNYTEYKNVAHDSWTATYSDENVLKWLFSQKKSTY